MSETAGTIPILLSIPTRAVPRRWRPTRAATRPTLTKPP